MDKSGVVQLDVFNCLKLSPAANVLHAVNRALENGNRTGRLYLDIPKLKIVSIIRIERGDRAEPGKTL
jgi:hypothetical protein